MCLAVKTIFGTQTGCGQFCFRAQEMYLKLAWKTISFLIILNGIKAFEERKEQANLKKENPWHFLSATTL